MLNVGASITCVSVSCSAERGCPGHGKGVPTVWHNSAPAPFCPPRANESTRTILCARTAHEFYAITLSTTTVLVCSVDGGETTTPRLSRPVCQVARRRPSARRQRRRPRVPGNESRGQRAAQEGLGAPTPNNHRVVQSEKSPMGGVRLCRFLTPHLACRYVAKTESELAGATISSAMDTLPDLASKVEKTRKPRPKARKPAAARRARARPIPGQASTAATPRPKYFKIFML